MRKEIGGQGSNQFSYTDMWEGQNRILYDGYRKNIRFHFYISENSWYQSKIYELDFSL